MGTPRTEPGLPQEQKYVSPDAYIERLELTVQQLRLELAALEADARRYRFIRDQMNFTQPLMQGGRAAHMIGNWGEDLDRVTDDKLAAKSTEA